jgi:endonuclease YncB( thermonuclease family)
MFAGLPCGIILAFAGSSATMADPCEAIPQKGPMPSFLQSGASFSGPVVYVGDGDGLCVALGPDATDWVEVRLADFYAPELQEPGGEAAKSALSRIVAGSGQSAASQPPHRRLQDAACVDLSWSCLAVADNQQE